MLAAFFDRFSAAFAAWQPAPAAVDALDSARAAAAAAVAAAAADPGVGKGAGQGSTRRRAQVQLVRGCSGGHPRALLAALVEGLERAPRTLGAGAAGSAGVGSEAAAAAAGEPLGAASPDAPGDAAAGGAAPEPPGWAQQTDGAVLHAAGLPLLGALRVLQRSAHNRAVLSSLGLLPTMCQLVRQLSQKLQAAADALAMVGEEAAAESDASTGGGGSGAPGPRGQLRLLRPLLVLLGEALLACQEFAEIEAAHRREAAVLAVQAGSGAAASHAAQAAAAQAASAGAAAAAAARTALAVAPLLERGMPTLCCELLPVSQQIQLQNIRSGGELPRRVGEGPSAAEEAAQLERRALHCLLALQAASPQTCAAALVQQAGGQGLTTLVSLLGWPLAPPEPQLSLSAAAVGSSASLALGPAPAAAAVLQEGQRTQQAQQAREAQQVASPQPDARALQSRYARIRSGSGLRSAADELQLQLLAVQAVGAAACGGGSAALRLLHQQACSVRLVQLLQWAALTFDAAGAQPSGPPSAAASAGPAQQAEQAAQGAAGSAQSANELQRLFHALWCWLGGGSGSGTARGLLPLLLGAMLAAFRPASAAGETASSDRRADGLRDGEAEGVGFAGAPPLELLQGPELAFHDAAVAALCRGAGQGASSDANGSGGEGADTSGGEGADTSGGGACGCALQQQVLLFAARLLGREQRMLPLLPPVCQQLYEQQQQAALARGGSVQTSGNEALTNLATLRASGGCMLVLPGRGIAFAGATSSRLVSRLLTQQRACALAQAEPSRDLTP